jgi:hypothetical protein
MIICVDFDGTLHSGNWPEIGAPVSDAVSVMNRLKADGHYLIIWTCREGTAQAQMVEWLTEKGIPFDSINAHACGMVELYGCDSRKVYAHLYIDDKQVGGLPKWDEIYKYVCKIEAAYKMLSLGKYAELTGINEGVLTGSIRSRQISDARQVYWHYLRKAGYTYQRIAEIFNRDHSTVLSATKRVDALLETGDCEIIRLYKLLK